VAAAVVPVPVGVVPVHLITRPLPIIMILEKTML
jgi:hypothetical protein